MDRWVGGLPGRPGLVCARPTSIIAAMWSDAQRACVIPDVTRIGDQGCWCDDWGMNAVRFTLDTGL